MTDLNKLADALDSYVPDGDGYNTEYSRTLQEAVARFRAAAGADVAQIMALHDDAVTAAISAAMTRLGDRHVPSRDALESALRLLVARVPQAQPISEAPKNRDVLLFSPHFGWVRGAWETDQYARKPRPYWSTENERSQGTRVIRENQPTHFMELPPAPKEAA